MNDRCMKALARECGLFSGWERMFQTERKAYARNEEESWRDYDKCQKLKVEQSRNRHES